MQRTAGGLRKRLKMSWRKGKGEEKNDENGKNIRVCGVCPRMFRSRSVAARAVGELGFATHGWRLAKAVENVVE